MHLKIQNYYSCFNNGLANPLGTVMNTSIKTIIILDYKSIIRVMQWTVNLMTFRKWQSKEFLGPEQSPTHMQKIKTSWGIWCSRGQTWCCHAGKFKQKLQATRYWNKFATSIQRKGHLTMSFLYMIQITTKNTYASTEDNSSTKLFYNRVWNGQTRFVAMQSAPLLACTLLAFKPTNGVGQLGVWQLGS